MGHVMIPRHYHNCPECGERWLCMSYHWGLLFDVECGCKGEVKV